MHVSIFPNKYERHSPEGGVAGYELNLVEAISKSTLEKQYVVCQKQPGTLQCRRAGKIAILATFTKGLMFWIPILSLTHRIKPRIIHVQQEMFMFGGAPTALLLVPLVAILRCYGTVIVTIHGAVARTDVTRDFTKINRTPLPPWLILAAFKFIYMGLTRAASKIIVHEEAFSETLVVDYSCNKSKIHVIPHSIVTAPKVPKILARRSLGLSESGRMVLFMGYAAGYKGIDNLIYGFSGYSSLDEDAFLVIGAGKHPKNAFDASYLKWYEQLKNLFESEIRIKDGKSFWAGFIPDGEVGIYYSAADLLVFPYNISMSSSGPMALAMGYSVPFIASSVFYRVLPQSLLFENTPKGLKVKLREFFTSPSAITDASRLFCVGRTLHEVAVTTLSLYDENLRHPN